MTSASAPTADSRQRDGIIDKVRALLAKAASTEHEPERQAFEAKAQSLITRYQIEQGELDVSRTAIEGRIIDLFDWGNATRGVVFLYGGVAELNRCTAASRNSRGSATLILYGTAIDLELTQAMVDHLLPQLRLHLLRDRPRSRMSYAVGWVHEVVARLRKTQEAEASAAKALVPTNNAATEALSQAYSLRAPRSVRVDSSAYGFGALAAERADIGLAPLEES